jgi:hypothetical protein
MTTNYNFPLDGHVFHGFTGARFFWLAVVGKRQSLEVCHIPAIQPEGATSSLCMEQDLLGRPPNSDTFWKEMLSQ